MVLWFADWSVTVARALASERIGEESPLALIAQNRVFACSAAARAQGVRARLRLREAQALCPELVVLPYDPDADVRAFEPVLAAMEQVVAGVQPIRPGCCAIAMRGAARYYGGEREAAAAIVSRLRDRSVLGADMVRVAIADDMFAAELAAQVGGASTAVAVGKSAGASATAPVVVPPGGSREFLAPLPIEALGAPDLVSLLRRLGVTTVGQFAALPPESVEGRMGVEGFRLQQLASGRDPRWLVPRERAHDYAVLRSFDDPLDRVDQLAFAVRVDAERMITALGRARLVCTGLRVEFDTESGMRSSRLWLHPRFFTAADVIDRVRWQRENGAAGTRMRPTGPGAELRDDSDGSDHEWGGGVVSVTLIPEQLDEVLHHEPGFFGEPDTDRVHQVLSRVQGMIGHEGVLTARVVGGRSPAERQRFVAWGNATDAVRAAEGPWPGQLPAPAPASVFERRMPVRVYDSSGADVVVDDRGIVGDGPDSMRGVGARRILAWAGPWSVAERWWDDPPTPRRDRFQVIDDTGTAWLLVYEHVTGAAVSARLAGEPGPHPEGSWWLEARYD